MGRLKLLTVWNLFVIYYCSAHIVLRESTQDWLHRTLFNIPSHNLMVWGILFARFEICMYQDRIFWWWIGGWCFKKYSASLFIPMTQYALSFSSTLLSLNQYHLISHVFNILVSCLSLQNLLLWNCLFLGVSLVACGPMRLRLVACRYLNLRCWKVPHVSASASEYTAFRIVFHSVWIGTFLLGVGFIKLGDS